MHIQYLREFLTVAELSSYSKAAKQLFISQPPLSRHIATIEAEWDVELLYRNTHEVSLTPAGEELLPYIKSIVNNYDTILDKKELFHLGINETFNLGILNHGKNSFINPVITCLKRENPALFIRFYYYQPNPLFNAIINNAVDIGLIPISDHPLLENVEKIPYTKVAYNAIIPEGHKLYKKDALTIDDLYDESFVFLSEDPIITAAHSLSLSRCDIKPQKTLMTPNFDTVCSTVLRSGYISIQSNLIEGISFPGIKYIPIDDSRMYFDVAFCYLESNTNPAIELLKAKISNYIK